MTTSRRGMLTGVAGLAAIAWGWQHFYVSRQVLNSTPLPGLPGWQRIDLGAGSVAGNAANAALIGIGDDADAVQQFSPDELCKALYAAHGTGPQIAVFSDFFCPFCRRLIPKLASWQNPIAITWHELPLLGPASEIAARAAIAAELQGGYAPFQAAMLTGSFRPSPAFFRGVANHAGLDGNRLIAEMDGAEVAERLLQSRRAAETLGIYGTPSMTIGKTLVIGELTDRNLQKLLAKSAPSCS